MIPVSKTQNYRIVLTQSQKVVPRSSMAIPQPNFQKLTLKIGTSFWSIEDNFQTIYNNFNLLSYFSQSCGIKIVRRFYPGSYGGKNYTYPCDYFKIGYGDGKGVEGKERGFAIIQKSRDMINKEKLPVSVNPLKISYVIVQCQNQVQAQQKLLKIDQGIQAVCKITVIVNTEMEPFNSNSQVLLHIKNKKQVQSKQRQLIVFNVEDNSGWIQQNFKDRPIEAHHHRLSMIMKPGLDQIEYFYRESENQRSKIQKSQSVSLALQGGGCKGVLYIGAYKAIKKMMQKDKKVLSSVIGSSAGGILGLAICCDMKPEQVIQICQQKLSKITGDQTYKTVAEDESKIMEKTFKDVFKFLDDFNIVDDNIQKILKDFLLDPAAQSQILNLLLQVTNPEVQKLFLDGGKKDKLNLVGLLKASLMTGNKIGEIAIDCISSLLRKAQTWPQGTKPEIIRNLKSEQDITELAKNITMSQLYSLTKIQFTCTAVDIDNHILRFFNQKTTPHLPVCKAVQMTGSFPVAFKAQQWDQKWGKYYVHYDTIRREIDITGHRFTDGGTLANFPIKYLDNQDMRPMYFSHAKTANNNIYGIGLVTDIKPDPQKSKRISAISGRLIQIFKSKISGWDIFNYFKSATKKTISVSPNMFDLIAKIPLVQFIIELLKTYCKTKDNLIEQCFSHLSYETAADKSYNQQIIQRPNFMQVIEKVRKLSTRVNQILSLMKTDDDSFQRSERLFLENLKFIQSGSNAEICNVEILVKAAQIIENLLQAFFHSFFSNVKSVQQKNQALESLSKIVNKQIQIQTTSANVINGLMKICKNINKETIFVMCSMEKDFIKLKSICQALNRFYDQLKKDSAELMKLTITQIGQREKKYRNQFASHLKQISDRNFLDNQNHFIYYYQKISNSAVVTPLQTLKQLAFQIKQCQISNFFIEFQSLMHRNSIISYTLSQISRYYNKPAIANQKQGQRRDPDGIHIVLQSQALSQLFFFNYYAVVKECILDYNHKFQEIQIEKQMDKEKKKKLLRVTTMTATGFQSLAIFLCASDLPQSRVEQQIWKLRDLISLDRIKVQDRFNGNDWAKLTPILLREAQQMAVRNQKNIFTMIQSDISGNRTGFNSQFSKLKYQVESKTNQVRVSDQEMMTAIQSSLSYITNILMDMESSEFKDANNFIEKVALNIKPEMVLDHMREHSKSLVELFKFFFNKYKDLIQYLVGSSFFVIDAISKMLRPDQRLLAWKGILLCEVISGQRIKVLVKKILRELHLKQDTTLFQFHQCSRQKIQLNFSVVEESVVSIFNHKTRPNMPMWAALLAASSTPDFFAPLLDRPEWSHKIDENYQIRSIKSYFSSQTKPFKFLSSSQALTKMPVDLLKNNQFQKKITNLNNEIFLVFSFGQIDIPNINNIRKLQIENITESDILKKFVSFFGLAVQAVTGHSPDTKQKSNLAGLKMAVSIPAFQSKKKMISLYIQSHDNLITQLYKRELIQVPIRLDTLDFHLMTQKQNGKDKLSDLCQDSIMQAYFIVREKIQNKYSDLQIEKLVGGLGRRAYPHYQAMQQDNLKPIQIGTQLFIKPVGQKQYQRLLYFRVQSTKLDPLYQKQLLSLNIQKIPDNLKLSNVLKIRFLSMLNPSNELYQQYFVYYRKSALDQTKSNIAPYVKIKNQSIYVNQQNYQKLYLKVQFSSSKRFQIKCNYYQLDLSELYQANLKINSQAMAVVDKQLARKYRFGFNYPLEFDSFYSPRNNKVVLNTVEDYKDDYMNRYHKMQAPRIGIISDIQGTIYASVACQKCVVPYHLIKKSTKLQQMVQNRPKDNQPSSPTSQTLVKCPKCLTSSLLSQHYKISRSEQKHINEQKHSNEQKECSAIQCILGHKLTRCKNNDKIGINEHEREILQAETQFIVCDLCGKGGLNCEDFWTDRECQVLVCDSCKIQALH